MRRFELNLQIKLETQIIASLSHPNIIKFKAFFENSETNCRILITEFFDSIPLNEFISQNDLKREEIQSILLQIISAFSYFHEDGILHQDLNVKNILINPKTHIIRIIDFGISQKITKKDEIQPFLDRQGNFKYRTPKKFLTEAQNCFYSDIWGICLIVFSFFMKKAISSKDAVKLNLIDEKFQTSVGELFEQNSKRPIVINDFFCLFEARWEKSKIL